MIFVHRSNIVVSTGTMLSNFEEGALVKLNENGSPVEFYVAKHDYEPGLNGAGRTLIVRKNGYKQDLYSDGGDNSNGYASCKVDIDFNGPYAQRLDPNILQSAGTTKFYYTPGNGDYSLSTLERKIFALSAGELGLTSSHVPNVEGQELPIASMLLLQYPDNDPSNPDDFWTRTPYEDSYSDRVYTASQGGLSPEYPEFSPFSYRPTLTLPSIILADDTGLIV